MRSTLPQLKIHLQVSTDLELAHSIANAVDSDAQVIAELLQAETQDEGDRQVAVRMSDGDSDFEGPPPYTEEAQESSTEAELAVWLISLPRKKISKTMSRPSLGRPSPMYVNRLMHSVIWRAKHVNARLARKAFAGPTSRSCIAVMNIVALV